MTTKITMLVYIISYPCNYLEIGRKYLLQVFRDFSGFAHILFESCKLLSVAVVSSSTGWTQRQPFTLTSTLHQVSHL